VQVLEAEGEEGVKPLGAERSRRGLAPQASGRTLLVRITGDATYDEVRDAGAELALPLNRLEQQGRRVEELFRDEGQGTEPGGATGETEPAGPRERQEGRGDG